MISFLLNIIIHLLISLYILTINDEIATLNRIIKNKEKEINDLKMIIINKNRKIYELERN